MAGIYARGELEEMARKVVRERSAELRASGEGRGPAKHLTWFVLVNGTLLNGRDANAKLIVDWVLASPDGGDLIRTAKLYL